MSKIKKAGFDIKFITLHVNLGTFAPVTQEHLNDSRMHEEQYSIDKNTADFLNTARAQGRPIIAVGTTVVRTLESAALTGAKMGQLKKLEGTTDLFITEKYKFKVISGMITNFHVPRSSLIMLVSAFVGRKKLLELYKVAIAHRFKLFSFGDGMLLVNSGICDKSERTADSAG